MWSKKCWIEGRSYSSDLLMMVLSLQPRMVLPGHAAGSCSAHCPPTPPGPFQQSCSPAWQSLPCIIARCCSFLCSGLCSCLLDSVRFLLAHFASLPRWLWMAALPSRVLSGPPSFVSSASLMSTLPLSLGYWWIIKWDRPQDRLPSYSICYWPPGRVQS